MSKPLSILLLVVLLSAGCSKEQPSGVKSSSNGLPAKDFTSQAASPSLPRPYRNNHPGFMFSLPTDWRAFFLTLEYKNDAYRFTFSLPPSWQGFSIVTETWNGYAVGPQDYGEVIEHGPMMVIRHPPVGSKLPYQDIPVMVFTLAQWADLADNVPRYTSRAHEFVDNAGA